MSSLILVGVTFFFVALFRIFGVSSFSAGYVN